MRADGKHGSLLIRLVPSLFRREKNGKGKGKGKGKSEMFVMFRCSLYQADLLQMTK